MAAIRRLREATHFPLGGSGQQSELKNGVQVAMLNREWEHVGPRVDILSCCSQFKRLKRAWCHVAVRCSAARNLAELIAVLALTCTLNYRRCCRSQCDDAEKQQTGHCYLHTGIHVSLACSLADSCMATCSLLVRESSSQDIPVSAKNPILQHACK